MAVEHELHSELREVIRDNSDTKQELRLINKQQERTLPPILEPVPESPLTSDELQTSASFLTWREETFPAQDIPDELDNVGKFFFEADRYPRLTEDEHRFYTRLYHRIPSTITHLANNNNCSEEEKAQQIKALEALRAQTFNQYVQSNLGLVIAEANKRKGRGVPMLDLIQEGSQGLMHAVDIFEIDRRKENGEPYRFSTVAMSWIKQSMNRYIANNSRNIRIPVHQHEKINKIGAIRQRIRTTTGEDPSIETLVKESGLSRRQTETTVALLEKQHTLSLDRVVNDMDEEQKTLGDFVEEEGSGEYPLVFAAENEIGEAVADALQMLTDRERMVISRFHGISVPKESLQSIGSSLNISKERVRQIKDEAEQKIRVPLEAKFKHQ